MTINFSLVERLHPFICNSPIRSLTLQDKVINLQIHYYLLSVAKHHPLDLKEGKSPKAKINRENLRQALILFKYLKPYRGKFILGMVFIAFTAFSTSLFPLFLGKMIEFGPTPELFSTPKEKQTEDYITGRFG